jgi:type VI secretion system protein ImpF
MAHVDKKKKLRASILERLSDNDPKNNTEGDADQHQRLKELRKSVRHDLEKLLNTRIRVSEPDDDYYELKKSLLCYGLPDLATVNILDKGKRNIFVKDLETLLIEFEPRFKSVTVNCLENADKLDRTLRFRIDATMYADPSPVTIVFDSILEPVSRTVNLAEAANV